MQTKESIAFEKVRLWLEGVLDARPDLSATSWAKAAGLTPSTVTKRINPPENEKRSVPSTTTIAKLAEAAGVPIPSFSPGNPVAFAKNTNRNGNYHNFDTTVKNRYTENLKKVISLPAANGGWLPYVPGGDMETIKEIDLGEIQYTEGLFVQDILPVANKDAYRPTSVIGLLSGARTPTSGDECVIRVVRGNEAKYLHCRVEQSPDGDLSFTNLSVNNSPVAPMTGETFEIVGRIKQWRRDVRESDGPSLKGPLIVRG